MRSRSSEGWKEKSKPASVLIGRQAAHAQRRLDAAVLAQGQFFGEQDVDGLERADLAALEPAHDVVERLQRARHLQADQVVADAVERRRRQSREALMARLSWARRRATAS